MAVARKRRTRSWRGRLEEGRRGRGRGGVRMVVRGSCAAAAAAAVAVGWEPGERNRRDDNICIIFNARTSGLRGGRQPLSARRLCFFLVASFGLLSRSLWSPSSVPPATLRASLTTALLRRHPRTPPRPPSSPSPSSSLATPSNIPLKSIPPHCLLYLPTLIIRTQICCVSLAARNLPFFPSFRSTPRPVPRIYRAARLRYHSAARANTGAARLTR